MPSMAREGRIQPQGTNVPLSPGGLHSQAVGPSSRVGREHLPERLGTLDGKGKQENMEHVLSLIIAILKSC